MSGPELAAIRRQEQLNAAAVLGVKSVDFFNAPDGELYNNDDSRKFLTRLVRLYKPVRPEYVSQLHPEMFTKTNPKFVRLNLCILGGNSDVGPTRKFCVVLPWISAHRSSCCWKYLSPNSLSNGKRLALLSRTNSRRWFGGVEGSTGLAVQLGDGSVG